MNDVVSSSRAAKWLVGDRLAAVLHIGDGPLAHELADQGHEVTIVTPTAPKTTAEGINCVLIDEDRLPFRSGSFDVVIAPELDDFPSALAEYARVLVPHGLLSTMARHYDDSIPWMRKLRMITGDQSETLAELGTFTASGLFHVPETHKFSAWEQLDKDALMRFAESTRQREVPIEALSAVEDLWQEYGRGTGSLRLRHETECIRAHVDKSALPAEPDPPDTVLINFS